MSSCVWHALSLYKSLYIYYMKTAKKNIYIYISTVEHEVVLAAQAEHVIWPDVFLEAPTKKRLWQSQLKINT